MKFLNRFFFVGVLAGAMLAVGVPLLGFGVFTLVVGSSSDAAQPSVGLQPLVFPSAVGPALDWEVRGMDGRTANVANLDHTVLFVNNWATWCGPCIREMPDIENLVGAYEGQDVAFVIVSDEGLEKVQGFVEDKGWELPVYVTEKRPPMFQTRAIPSTFILDEDRRVVYTHIGSAAWGDESAQDFIDRLLGDAPPRGFVRS